MDTQSKRERSPEEGALWKSGRYRPAMPDDNLELGMVQAHDLDLQLEEFPEGPYGSIRDEPLGKVTPHGEQHRSVSSHRDQNLMHSPRKTPVVERPNSEPQGTIEGQN